MNLFLLDKPFYFYVILLCVILGVSYFGKIVNTTLNNTTNKDEYELVKEYLLNDSPLYGNNKPKIWIHTSYEINARKWKSFQSRNTKELNQPYIYLTIQSIINHCSEHFHICLIDDDSFDKLIPNWDISVSKVAEPMKHVIRQIGLMQLLFYYGGIIVPNSFLCLQDLTPLYKSSENNPICSECLNIHADINNISDSDTNLKKTFVPGWTIVGAHKNSEEIKKWIEELKKHLGIGHFNSTYDIYGIDRRICNKSYQNIDIISGDLIGIKNIFGEPILLNHLFDEESLHLDTNKLYGIIIPRDEILKRTKYQWFAVLSIDEILKSNMVITKYFKLSMINYEKYEHIPKSSIFTTNQHI